MSSEIPPSTDILIPDFSVQRGMAWLKRRHQLLTGNAPDLRLLRTDAYRIIFKAEQDESLVAAALKRHLELCESGNLLKSFEKRRISRVEIDGRSFIVKEFRRIFKFFTMLSPDRRTWLGINRLQGACPVLAWIRSTAPCAGYLLLEDGGVQDLMMHLDSPMMPVGPQLFYAAGRIIARLHALGVFHADCKASNFVARQLQDGRYSVSVIDCDDIRVLLSVPTDKVARNLAQFLGVTWDLDDFEIRRNMSEKFLDGFCHESGRTRRQLQPMIPKILKEIARLYPGQEIIMARILK